MSLNQLSEYQQTIKELQKLGTFNEEELLWLENMEKSMDELKDEVATNKLAVTFVNHSTNPDPEFNGNKVNLQAYLTPVVSSTYDDIIHPNGIKNVPTGIMLELPENISFQVITPTKLLKNNIAVLGSFIEENQIFVSLKNCSTSLLPIRSGDIIGEVVFTYYLSNVNIELKPFQS